MVRIIFAVMVSAVLAACSSPPAPPQEAAAPEAGSPPPAAATPEEATIRMAVAAAPADISDNAAVVEPGPGGEMKQVRAGTNGWVCMAHPEPMCLDKEWQGWADAWMNKKDPQIKGVGVGYMLQGDKGASNTDPYATAPTADNQWIVSPPHIMILTPDARQLDALPTDPQNGGPWVMWKGTKYAHIMVPTVPMPARP
jgi:hypothetical protein